MAGNVRPHTVTRDLTYIVDKPWGLALLVLAILVPRLLLRSRDPAGLARFGSKRLFFGYAGAIVAALSAVLISEPLGVRSWAEAMPVRSAVELMAASATARFLLAASVAWLFAAYVVAPLTAWLGTYSLANGLLVLAACLPVAVTVGVGTWLAWPEPARSLSFNLASAVALMSSACVGFAVGARIPLTFTLAQRNAA